MSTKNPLAHEPFGYRELKDGRVQISRSGRVVKILTGNEAARFLARIVSADALAAQQLMARTTGQFKFGNERLAKEKRRRR